MFSKLVGVALLIQTLFTLNNAAAVAYFSANNSGVEGSVWVDSGYVRVTLDLSALNATASLPGGDACLQNGLKYHIHQKWARMGGDFTDRLGPNECGSTYTGGHWDPWYGCGSATGERFCDYSNKPTWACIPGSSDWESGNLGYSCSSDNFTINPYVCEVGDWSGKYGVLTITDDMVSAENSSPYEVDGKDLGGLSVVFHCGDSGAARAFCAPFQNTDEDTDTGTRPTQSGSYLWRANFVVGQFDMKPNNEYEYSFQISSLPIPADCDWVKYRVYEKWNSSTTVLTDNAACSLASGDYWDPTITCGPNTNSEYCYGAMMERCGNQTTPYNCQFDKKGDRFSCGVGDLSGKYGLIQTNTSESVVSGSGVDPLMMPLSDLAGKSLALTCDGSDAILACAQFYQVAITPAPTEAADSPESTDVESTDLGYRIEIGISMIAMMIFSIFM